MRLTRPVAIIVGYAAVLLIAAWMHFALKPHSAEDYIRRGNAHYDKSDYDRAIADYDTAIALKPDFAIAYVNRATARIARGDSEGAEADLSKAFSLKGNSILFFRSDPLAVGNGSGGFAGLATRVLMGVGGYVLFALAWSEIARKCGEDGRTWWAWVPLLSIWLMLDLADMAAWWLLLSLLLPLVFPIALIWCGWNVSDRLGKPPWLGAFFPFPPINLIAFAYLAWGPEPSMSLGPSPTASAPAARPRRVQRGGGRR